jgi:hypothetical protein
LHPRAEPDSFEEMCRLAPKEVWLGMYIIFGTILGEFAIIGLLIYLLA